MDENTYKLGVKALETMDAYNNAELDEDEAREKLDAIYNRLNERTFNDDEFSQELQNGEVVASFLYYDFTMSSGGDLIDRADSLSKKVNK